MDEDEIMWEFDPVGWDDDDHVRDRQPASLVFGEVLVLLMDLIGRRVVASARGAGAVDASLRGVLRGVTSGEDICNTVTLSVDGSTFEFDEYDVRNAQWEPEITTLRLGLRVGELTVFDASRSGLVKRLEESLRQTLELHGIQRIERLRALADVVEAEARNATGHAGKGLRRLRERIARELGRDLDEPF